MNEEINPYLHEVVLTAIVIKDDKYLITHRAKPQSSGKWTVPHGKLQTSSYIQLPKDAQDYWDNVLEQTLKQEVAAGVGLEIENIQYVTSLARVGEDNNPSLIISCMADYASGEVALHLEEIDAFAWVSLEEAKEYELLDGIYDKLALAESRRRGKGLTQ